VAEFTAEHLREYASRDWALRARTKHEGVQLQTPTQALALSEMLWKHMRQVDPSWPDAEQRREDLEHHQRLVDLNRRLSDALFPR